MISAPTATPAETAAAPTPWPTRIPAGMAPPGATEEPTAIPLPPTPRQPAPLTPIVTTPTPEVTPAPVPLVAETPFAPEPVLPTETPVAPAADVSVGRAGGGLLAPESVLTPVPTVIWPTPTANAPAARPDASSRSDAYPAAGGEHTDADGWPDSPLLRWWRDVLGRVLP